MSRFRHWVPWVFISSDRRRLLESIPAFEGEHKWRTQHAGAQGSAWVLAVDELLKDAKVACGKDGSPPPWNLDEAWALFHVANRLEIFGYGPDELADARVALRDEATTKLTSWRASAISRILDQKPGGGPPDEYLARLVGALAKEVEQASSNAVLGEAAGRVARILEDARSQWPQRVARTLVEAVHESDWRDRVGLFWSMGIRDEDFRNKYRRIRLTRRQLATLAVVLAAALGGLLILAMTLPVSLDRPPAAGSKRIWGYVLVLGTIGACLSAIQSVSARPTRAPIPEHIQHGLVMLFRPLVGAAAAAGAYVLFSSGFLSLAHGTTATFLAIAFAAGFSERLVTRATEAIAGTGGKGGDGG